MLPTRSLLAMLCGGGVLLTAAPAQGQCPVRIEAGCGPTDGDVARCTFVLRGASEGSQAPVTLRFVEDSSYTVEPPSLQLTRDQVADAKVTVLRSDRNPGLIRLQGAASGTWGPECTPKVDFPMDFLLDEQRVVVAPGSGIYTPEASPPETVLELNRVTTFTFKVVDPRSEQPLKVPVPLTATLETVDGPAALGVDSRNLSPDPLIVTLGERQSSQTVFMRPLAPGLGRLRIQVRLDLESPSVASAQAQFRTEHPLPRRVGCALLGACAYWVLLLVARRSEGLRGVLSALAKVIAACGVGYFVAPYLGTFGFRFQADPSRLESQFVLGLLLACLGAEGLLGLLTRQIPRGAQGAAPPPATSGG